MAEKNQSESNGNSDNTKNKTSQTPIEEGRNDTSDNQHDSTASADGRDQKQQQPTHIIIDNHKGNKTGNVISGIYTAISDIIMLSFIVTGFYKNSCNTSNNKA